MIRTLQRFLQTPSQLNQKGILGLNCRNGDYISLFNHRRHFPLVDNKLITKQLAHQHHIAVPPLYADLGHVKSVRSTLRALIQTHQQLVIKPAQGSRGDGILIIDGISPNTYSVPKHLPKNSLSKSHGSTDDQEMIYYRLHDDSLMTEKELEQHCIHILAGLYSIGGKEDRVLCEYRVQFADYLKPYTFLGAPDIRIIVFQGYPVMAMLRLPTRISGGKANLHQGGIGVGIDIQNGHGIIGTYLDKAITYHPETGADLRDIVIQDWEQILHFSAKCYEMTKLGYLGVDLIIDQQFGPMMVELNARPGLQIQVANQAGLRTRLQQVSAQLAKNPLASLAERISWAQQQFSSSG